MELSPSQVANGFITSLPASRLAAGKTRSGSSNRRYSWLPSSLSKPIKFPSSKTSSTNTGLSVAAKRISVDDIDLASQSQEEGGSIGEGAGKIEVYQPTTKEIASLVNEQARSLQERGKIFAEIPQDSSSPTLRHARRAYPSLAKTDLASTNKFHHFIVALFIEMNSDNTAKKFFHEKGILNDIEGFYKLYTNLNTVQQNMDDNEGTLSQKDLEMIRKVLIDNPINFERTPAAANLIKYTKLNLESKEGL
jgi:hypothetical protein